MTSSLSKAGVPQSTPNGWLVSPGRNVRASLFIVLMELFSVSPGNSGVSLEGLAFSRSENQRAGDWWLRAAPKMDALKSSTSKSVLPPHFCSFFQQRKAAEAPGQSTQTEEPCLLSSQSQ